MNNIVHTIAFVTYGYDDGLINTLSSLVRSCVDYLEEPFEDVIIINNNSYAIYEGDLQRESNAYFQIEVQDNLLNQGLARSWNQCIRLCKGDNLLICNDDLEFKEDWHETIRKKKHSGRKWIGHPSCFYFDKRLIKEVGWFEERMTFGGFEDDDYRIRMQQANIKFFEEKGLLAHNIKAGKIGTRKGRYIFDDKNYNKHIFKSKWKKTKNGYVRNPGWNELNWYPMDQI